jgi:polyisoprenoid-binding protein YceI
MMRRTTLARDPAAQITVPQMPMSCLRARLQPCRRYSSWSGASAPEVAVRAAALLFTLVAFSAFAQKTIALHLDPATTHINWTLDTTIHTVHGTFKLKEGNLKIDPATGNASGLIVIDAASGDSADSARDKRMNAAILESAKFPAITFRPTHIDGKIDLTASGTVTVNGVFNLHGQDHPMQLTVSLHPQPSAIALATRFTIPFVAWGLKDPSVLLLRTAKQVTLDIDAIATQSTPQAISEVDWERRDRP